MKHQTWAINRALIQHQIPYHPPWDMKLNTEYTSDRMLQSILTRSSSQFAIFFCERTEFWRNEKEYAWSESHIAHDYEDDSAGGKIASLTTVYA
jgi:hypothetical protein